MNTKTPGVETQRPIKLSCRNLWKVFGANGAEFLRARNGTASASELDAASLIGAVRGAGLRRARR